MSKLNSLILKGPPDGTAADAQASGGSFFIPVFLGESADRILSKQTVNSIYDSGNYMDAFESDIVEAEKYCV